MKQLVLMLNGSVFGDLAVMHFAPRRSLAWQWGSLQAKRGHQTAAGCAAGDPGSLSHGDTARGAQSLLIRAQCALPLAAHFCWLRQAYAYACGVYVTSRGTGSKSVRHMAQCSGLQTHRKSSQQQ
jgi:hypothetical protein